MKWSLVAIAFVTGISAFNSAPVYANDLMDTVRARGNARAGGPTNGHDAWILDRYGRLSGTYSSSYSGLGFAPDDRQFTGKKQRKLRRRY